MKGARIGKTSKTDSTAGTDWKRVRQIDDAEIRRNIQADADAVETDEGFWRNAKVVWPAPKEAVTIRLDADLLGWFRQQRGYQTRINAILRTYMNAHTLDKQR